MKKLLLSIAVSVALLCLVRGIRVEGAAPAAPNPARRLTVEQEYTALLKEIKTYNVDGIDAWTMNSEHLFVGVGDLRDRVIVFVRRDGALDLLFGRLLDDQVSKDEVLAVAELLVYFGQYDEKGDARIWSKKAPSVAIAVAKGRLIAAEKEFPDAPITSRVLYAIRKSIRNAEAAVTTQPSR